MPQTASESSSDDSKATTKAVLAVRNKNEKTTRWWFRDNRSYHIRNTIKCSQTTDSSLYNFNSKETSGPYKSMAKQDGGNCDSTATFWERKTPMSDHRKRHESQLFFADVCQKISNLVLQNYWV